MEHLVSFTFNIDDDRISELLSKNAYKDILDRIQDEMRKELPKKYGYYGNSSNGNVDWRSFLEPIAEEFMNDHKDEIIEAAAAEVVKSIKRSKKYRDAVDACATAVEEE